MAERNIFEEGVIITVSIRNYPWRVTIKPEEFGLDEFPNNVKPGSREILPHRIIQALAYLEGKARAVPDKLAFSYGIGEGKTRFKWVHLSKVTLVCNELDRLKAEFFDLVAELMDTYEDLKEEMRAEYPEQWPFIKNRYLPLAAIPGKYSFERSLHAMQFPTKLSAVKAFELKQADLALADRERVVKLTQEQMHREMLAYRDAQDRVYAEARATAQEQMERFVSEAVMQLRGTIVETFTQITTKLREGKKLTATNLETLRAKLDEVKALDFLGSDETFHTALARVETLLGSGQTFTGEEAVTTELHRILNETVATINQTSDRAVAIALDAYAGRRLKEIK